MNHFPISLPPAAKPGVLFSFRPKHNRSHHRAAVTGVTTASYRDDNHQFRPPPQGLEQWDHFFSAHSWRTVSSCTRLDSSEDQRRFWMMYLYDTVTLESPWERTW